MPPVAGGASAECLDEGTGAALVAGRLKGRELSVVEHHLDSCDSCQAFAAALAKVAGSRPDVFVPSDVLLAGTAIDRYTVVAELGRGASAVVYEVIDPKLDRHVALKLMHADSDEQRGALLAARMLDEARAMAQLSHPNVLAVHDTGTAGKSVFIAMELCDGATLGEWSKQHTPRQRIAALLGAGRGLEAAHAAGLVHRDFKPENVLCGSDGRVLVTDFGLVRTDAHNADDLRGDLRLTRTGHIVGTPAYMAPEQLRGASDALSDQFSFCVTLYEVIAGRRPFAGKNFDDLFANVSANRVRASLSPRWLDRIVRRGLSPDPAKRFPSMSALLAALERGQRARRWRLQLAVVVLALSGVAAYALLSRVEETSCSDASAAQISRVWNEPRQTQIEAAFAGTGVAYADDAWQSARSSLEAYARSVQLDRVASCHESGNQDLAAVERACYRDRIEALDALLEIFADADVELVKRATEAAAGLPSVDACRQPAALRQAAAAPELARQLARSRALLDTGRYEQALSTAEGLAASASGLGDKGTEADAALIACGANAKLGNPKEAEEACHHAALTAQQAGDSRRAAGAWAFLVGLVGNERGRYAEAERWAEYARAAIEQSGGDDQSTAMLEHSLGIIDKQQGEFETARTHYMAALTAFEKRYGEKDLRVARVLNNLAILEGKRGERDASLAYHKRSLAIRRESLGENHPDVAVALLNIGLVESSSGHYDSAREYLEQALRSSAASLPAEHPQIGLAHANLGLLEYRLGRYEEALPHLERAVEIVRAVYGADHPKLAVVIDNLGLAQRALGRPAEALALHQEAWAIGQAALGERHSDVLNSWDNQGDALLDLNRSDEALEHFRFTLAVRQGTLGNEHPDVVWTMGRIGRGERLAGNIAASTATLERALAIVIDDKEITAELRFDLAQTLALSDKGEQARALATLAKEGANPALARDIDRWLAR